MQRRDMEREDGGSQFDSRYDFESTAMESSSSSGRSFAEGTAAEFIAPVAAAAAPPGPLDGATSLIKKTINEIP